MYILTWRTSVCVHVRVSTRTEHTHVRRVCALLLKSLMSLSNFCIELHYNQLHGMIYCSVFKKLASEQKSVRIETRIEIS